MICYPSMEGFWLRLLFTSGAMPGDILIVWFPPSGALVYISSLNRTSLPTVKRRCREYGKAAKHAAGDGG